MYESGGYSNTLTPGLPPSHTCLTQGYVQHLPPSYLLPLSPLHPLRSPVLGCRWPARAVSCLRAHVGSPWPQ